jgi:hypothetical protein
MRFENIEGFYSLFLKLLPMEVLSLELNALGADTQATKSKIVKSKTRI